ncbi:MFS transporter [Comamonas sp. Tr-654]|uniref:MFS transporter n=1 Tax=Comamonas sp. Tr-654 TaxID=2608341 RepID=UPI0014219C20|nr:MFS transporter [Comamonas sp. Tr-654]NIF84765.1 MFS transporter [Comamonas sp. Tr-654]
MAHDDSAARASHNPIISDSGQVPAGKLLEDPSAMHDGGAPPAAAPGVWTPLATPTFRMLWMIWMTANICMWMNDVAAAWLMTSLTTSPVLVALVQSASTMPVMLLALPSGALADILDRRRYFIVTQFWVAAVALLLCLAVLSGQLTPYLLLALVFANGIGLAMRWPVFSALIPELVPKHHLPFAMALNGVAMNASRIIGPLVAGALIASLGSAWVFVLNAVLSIVSGFVLLRWKRQQPANPLGRERLGSAMRVGLQFIQESPRMHAVLLRTVCYFLQAAAIMALLPLTAQRLDHGTASSGSAGTFTLLLASMGAGAILGAMLLPRIRQMLSGERTVLAGVAAQSLATLTVAFAPHIAVAVPGMMLSGLALLATANTLGVAAQMALPNWVRARGMSIYQMSIMGSTAIGAAIWGKVASLGSVQISMAVAAVSGLTALLIVQRLNPDRDIEEDLSPSRAFTPPTALTPEAGRVVVTIEYLIDPARTGAFRDLMQLSRRSRLRQGALSWSLLHSMSQPERFVEQITDESWTEHLRRFERVTTADVALRDRKLSFHKGKEPPVVQRYFTDAL